VGPQGARGEQGVAGRDGASAIPGFASTNLTFPKGPRFAASTSVSSNLQQGKSYFVETVIEVGGARAISRSSLLALSVSVASESGANTFARSSVVNSVGLNSSGRVVQTVVVRGTYNVTTTSDPLKISLTSKGKKKWASVKGSISYFEVTTPKLSG